MRCSIHKNQTVAPPPCVVAATRAGGGAAFIRHGHAPCRAAKVGGVE